MIKNPINILLLNGAMFEIDKIRNIPATSMIDVKKADLNTDLNEGSVKAGLHLLTTERAAAGQAQGTQFAGEYEPSKDDIPTVIKFEGKLLLLLGHQVVAAHPDGKSFKAKLVTTVAMKERAKIHMPIEAPVPASKPWPQKTYPQEFSNKPRFHPTPKPNLHEPSSRPARAKR